MSETDNPVPTDATENKSCGSGRCSRRKRSPVRKAVGLLFFLGAFVGIPYAVAHAGGMGGHCGGGGEFASAEELREHMDRPAGWMLNKIDATDEQEAKVDAVLDRVAPELFALKADHEAIRDELRTALTADQIDAQAIEEIRKDGLALADDASKIVIGGIVDIANVLDKDQRAELDELAQRWHK